MNTSELIAIIKKGWPTYRALAIVNSNEDIHRWVVDEFPALLKSSISVNYPHLLWKGSTGTTQITAAPWIATLDDRITTSAQRGYYVVYLYSIDLKRLYLAMAFGAKQFQDIYSKTSQRFTVVASAIELLRDIFHKHIPTSISGKVKHGLIDLAATPSNKNHYDYEHGTIYFIEYDLNNLPDEDVLVNDYRKFVDFYERTVADPLTPDIESLVKATVDFKTIEKIITSKEFEIRLPKKKKAQSTKSNSFKRHTKESKVIGDLGEDIVIEYERNRLNKLGKGHLASEIVHEDKEKRYPGWDITSFNELEENIYIEVKATSGDTINSIELTVNEWEAAKNPQYRDNYYLYLVTKVLSAKPCIECLRNPFAFVESGELSIQPIRFELSLQFAK